MRSMMDNLSMDLTDTSMVGMGEFVVPESLFESLDQLDYGHQDDRACAVDTGLLSELMDSDMLLPGSDTMASFLEMESVPEVEPVKAVTRPSVIMKNTTKAKAVSKELPVPSLSEILTSCGIEYDMVEPETVEPEPVSPVASPGSSLGSDMEKNQELIEELEDFFLKTEGSPTQVTMDDTVDLKLEDLDSAMTTSLVTPDGQPVIIIVAPSSPADSLLSSSGSLAPDTDTDPEWSPVSPAASDYTPTASRPRKKYERTKKPRAPTGPYPTDRKERKKAQNRTAAFRYREKMKAEADQVEDELQALEDRNASLKEQFAEMQTEFKYLKKLMTEAGLGHYAAVVNC